MRPLTAPAALLAALLATVTLPAAAGACGAFFEPIEDTTGAAFETQSVLIHRRADRLDMHLRMTVAPGAQTFSWVLPAPPDAALSLGDDALFDALDDLTRPVIDIEFVGGSGGCSPADSAGAAPDDRFEVLEVGRIGEYDYAIIASGDAAAAAGWLTDNGFAVPEGGEAAMQPYADAGMNFIGVRLARPADRPDEAARPTPLVLSVPDAGGDLPRYPLGLSALSADRVLPVLIYVLGPQRAAVQGAESTTVVAIADRILGQRYLEYAEAVDLAQEEATGPLWVTDAVILDPGAASTEVTALGPASERAVLTRLSARLPLDRIADVNLTWHPDGQAAVDPYQHRAYGDPDGGCNATSGPTGPAWLILLLLGGWRLGRRRRP